MYDRDGIFQRQIIERVNPKIHLSNTSINYYLNQPYILICRGALNRLGHTYNYGNWKERPSARAIANYLMGGLREITGEESPDIPINFVGCSFSISKCIMILLRVWSNNINMLGKYYTISTSIFLWRTLYTKK